MELRHLRYFVAAAEKENVSRAAAKLHVSQPALSRQIRDLEEELGFQLLERSAKSVRLTEAGRVFAVEARAVLARAAEAVRAAREAARGEGGELHLGYAPSPTAELLPRVLHAFQNAAPGVRVVLHDNSTGEMIEGLNNGTLHAALLVKPMNHSLRGLVFEPLLNYPVCVAMAPRHPLARASSLRLERLRSEKLVALSRADYGEYHELLERVFAPVGRLPEIAEECDSAPSVIAAVEARRGVAIVPSVFRCQAGERLKIRPILPPPDPLVVGFAHRIGKIPPATERLVQTLRALRDGATPVRPSRTPL